jgi:hypothetical protein
MKMMFSPNCEHASTKRIFSAAMLAASLGFAHIVSAQTTTSHMVNGTVRVVSQLKPPDVAEFALFITPSTPGDPAAPANNNCVFDPVYFGASLNPTARERTLHNSLIAAGIAGKPITLYYTKSTTQNPASTTKYYCFLDRVDLLLYF